jgi:hypothetical protein
MMISNTLLVFVPSPAVRAKIQIHLMIAVLNQPAAVSFFEVGRGRREEGKRLLSMPIAARAVEIGRRVVRRGMCDSRDVGLGEERAEMNWRRIKSWINIASQRGPMVALLTG